MAKIRAEGGGVAPIVGSYRGICRCLRAQRCSSGENANIKEFMTATYTVITDIASINKHEKRLEKRLKDALRNHRVREIAYPSARHVGHVYFEHSDGTNVRAWSPLAHDNKLVNFFIFGDPNAQGYLAIDVQLNFPSGVYDRSLAGAFVVDSSGEVFLAHRGHLTRGTKLKKEDVLKEFAARSVWAKDVRQRNELILICALEDPELVNRLFAFAEEARDVANDLGNRRKQQETTTSVSVVSDGNDADPTGKAMKLRAYFDEHSGESNTSGYAGGLRVVTHGLVVKSLEKALRQSGQTLKSQAIDLAVLSKSVVRLFEVKTSSNTTDVYTGVGQLLLHGEGLYEELQIKVQRFLVVPGQPKKSFIRHMSRKAGIEVITYEETASGHRFSELPGHA